MIAPQSLAGNNKKADESNFSHVNCLAKWAVAASMGGAAVSPRGMETREIFNASATLTNPRNRMLSVKGRRWNRALAIGEFCWHMSQANDVETLAYYAPVWNNFTDDGRHIQGSCYGRKIFSRVEGRSQWDIAKSFLLSDKSTRRAIISVGGFDKDNTETLDLSCLQSLHFFIRDDKLNLICHMRSNDAFIGLPYDIFLFTMLQEVMSFETGVSLGNYTHIANSLHIYEKDESRAISLINGNSNDVTMDPISNLDDMWKLIALEKSIRLGSNFTDLPKSAPWNGFASILIQFSSSRVRQL